MRNINDEKIIVLKKKIEDKREKLKNIKKFNPITNCSIELDGQRYNLNVLGLKELRMLAIKLNSYRLSALDLGVKFSIDGFKVEDWIIDIRSKLDLLNVKEEERGLVAMENKLTQLLSNEKQVELEISEIENMLK